MQYSKKAAASKISAAFCFLFFTTCTWAHAEPISYAKVKAAILNPITAKIIHDNPFLCSSDIRIEIRNADEIALIPTAATRCELEIRPKANLLGESSLPLWFYNSNNKKIEKTQVYVKTIASTQFIRSRHMLKKGQRLNADDFDYVYEEMNGKPQNTVTTLNVLIGKEAYSTIPAKVIITDHLIRSIPDIRINDTIAIIIEKNNVQIIAKGQALDDGYIGDKIRVRSLMKDAKILTGEIIDANTIRVQVVN